jgi:hypothetical protein
MYLLHKSVSSQKKKYKKYMKILFIEDIRTYSRMEANSLIDKRRAFTVIANVTEEKIEGHLQAEAKSNTIREANEENRLISGIRYLLKSNERI